MQLLTDAIVELLRKNGEHHTTQKPICKLFNPAGAQTWLIFCLDNLDEPYPDVVWGLADLGNGIGPEWGTMSIKEMETYNEECAGVGIERDLHWRPKNPDWKLANYLELDSLSDV